VIPPNQQTATSHLWGTEFNKARHVQADDARPLKRPFTPTELQQFFDLADLAPERILNAGRKGALAAWRDAIAFKQLAWVQSRSITGAGGRACAMRLEAAALRRDIAEAQRHTIGYSAAT
jgi:hypothetical protein